MPVVVDSSGWLEYFFEGALASEYEAHVQNPEVLVPTVVLYEVYKVLKSRLPREAVALAMAQLSDRETVPLHEAIALAAAERSLEYGLSMADAIIYATARHYDAELISSDSHFEALPGVQYLPKP